MEKINDDKEIFKRYLEISRKDKNITLKELKSSEEGLNSEIAKKYLKENGQNIAFEEKKHSWFYFLLISFKDQFILILLFLAIINFGLGDKLGSGIIVLIALISALIRFFQDYSVYLFNNKLKSKIYSSSIVLRDKKEVEIRNENIVIGDIVKLNAGAIIPADLLLLETNDLFINASSFTGESVPVEKTTEYIDAKEIFDLQNICLMGSSVVSGSAEGIIISTGVSTYLGHIGSQTKKKEITNFDKGMKNVTTLLIKYMVAVCFFVLIVDGVLKHNLNEAILFALSVAVGITPSMLPMIVNVNLTKGSKSLAKKKTLVKRIESIQNLGSIDILCTDKTGTLTENNIILQKYIDINGDEDLSILEYAYLNSVYATGMKNLVDRAILSYAKEHKVATTLNDYHKIDEIPFDYNRRKLSVVVEKDKKYRIITKGALEEILECCTTVYSKGKTIKITKELKNKATKKAQELATTGMQVIALCTKNTYSGIKDFSTKDENEMTFVGLVGFLDPPKKDAKDTILKLREIGISTKILTGDNPYATKNICALAGLNDEVLLGSDIDSLTDKELARKIEHIDVFTRLNPLQKERIVSLYKKNGHVVGYMGDGVNDAPSLNAADIGISVNSATDIAKESSDLILLERSLKVIYDGVIEGRKVYGNIIKYMKMALSGDFGDVFSIMVASIFLPFLPLLPIQMLIQDFIYDFSQIAIPYDNVDPEFLKIPRKWDTKDLSRFMKVMGITSSIVDVISFVIFWYILGYNSPAYAASFQTAWFVTCLLTELMIIYNVRTSKKPFVESMPSKPLFIMTLVSAGLTIITPMLLHNIPTFNYVILPKIYYYYLFLLVVLYFALVTLIKEIYIKKYGEWL